jgi:hypothetical protein
MREAERCNFAFLKLPGRDESKFAGKPGGMVVAALYAKGSS